MQRNRIIGQTGFDMILYTDIIIKRIWFLPDKTTIPLYIKITPLTKTANGKRNLMSCCIGSLAS